MKDSNYDDVFIRKCIVGTLSCIYDSIEISQVSKNETKKIKVPVYYSLTGKEDFIRDLFLDKEKYCKELSGKVNGTAKRTLPYGILKLEDNIKIDTSELNSDGARINYKSIVDSELGKKAETLNARISFLPISLSFSLIFRTDSEISRLKIFDSVCDNLLFIKKFFINFNGLDKIPCSIKFSEDASKKTKFEFSYDSAEPNIHTLELSIEFLSFKPIVNDRSVYKANNNNKTTIIRNSLDHD